MIKEWIEEYQPSNKEEAEQALREIMQEVALAGLQRSGFFEKAAFYGGTALRIFHGLNRFSEDLDFSLLEVNTEFNLEPYLDGIIAEFSSLGMAVSVKEKIKTSKTNVDSAFLKPETVWNELLLEKVIRQEGLGAVPNIKIKLEVDTEPPLGFQTEEKLLVKPFSFYVKCFILSDLFAGKMHALLFRKWKNRVKGRDWYDMEWYVKNGIPLNLDHFLLRALNSGDLNVEKISKEEFLRLISNKIENISFNNIREDIVRFIPDDKVLDIWSAKYFKNLVDKMKFK
jgi:predicted nucleotidyltransferase component of viral defense system